MIDLSDKGECIENVIDKLDSEILASLVNDRLKFLSKKQMGTIELYYGECFFRKSFTIKEIANIEHVTENAIKSRIAKARRCIIRPGTKLYKYITKDSFYKQYICNSKNHKQKKKEKRENNMFNTQDPSLKHFYTILEKWKTGKI